ncbi:ribosomal protein S5-alanine N-acetyltransferase [soil metagenome]
MISYDRQAPDSMMISSERVQLRIPLPSQAPFLAAFYQQNTEFFMPWTPERGANFYDESFWTYVLNRNLQLAVDDRALRFYVFLTNGDPNEPIGYVHFDSFVRGCAQHCSLAYAIGENYQKQGLMYESISECIAFIFGPVGMHRIQAGYIKRNLRSAHLLKCMGFEVEGCARQWIKIAGNWEDHTIVSLLNPDWQ